MKTEKYSLTKIVLLLLVIEKIVQHIFVTLAFRNNWNDIRSVVHVNPDVLMVLGGIAAILFAVSLWGLIKGRTWAINLLIGLALFDIIGEFAAQGVIAISITVSFVGAVVILILGLVYKRDLSRKSIESVSVPRSL